MAEAGRAGAVAETENAREWPDEDTIDLLDIANTPILKRLVPALGVAAALVGLIVWLVKRRKRGASEPR